MYFRLLAESLRRGSRRKLLAATAVAVGVLAATAVAEVLLAAGDRLAAELGSYGANLEVVPDEGRETFDAAGLAAVRDIFWRNNVVAVAPLYPLRVRLIPVATPGGRAAGPNDGPDEGVVAPLIGTAFDLAIGDGWKSGLPAVRPTLGLAAGRWPDDSAAGVAQGARGVQRAEVDGVAEGAAGVPGAEGAGVTQGAEVTVGRRLAARLGVGPGSTLAWELGSRRGELAVVGVVASGGEEDDAAFAPLAAVQAAAGRPAPGGLAGPVRRAEVFALTSPEAENRRDPKAMTAEEYDRWYCTAYPSSVAFQLGEAIPDAQARVVRGIAGATAELAGRLRPLLAALAAVALAGAAVGVTAVMTATVLERRLEAGLAAALGAERWKVMAFFLSEALLLGVAGGLAGGLAGLGAGSWLGEAVFGVAVAPAPVLVAPAIAAGAALAVLGSLPAVLRPLLFDPAALLKRAAA